MRTLFFTIVCIFLFTSARGQKPNSKLDITPLTGNFYIYTTYNEYQGSKTPAHGMYLVTKKGVVLFDTPWDTTQFQPLLDSIQKRVVSFGADLSGNIYIGSNEGLFLWNQKK